MRGADAAAWQQLYDAALLLQRLSPWQWMVPQDYFGVRPLPDSPIAFISLMGSAEADKQALFAFLGWEALRHIRRLARVGKLTIRDLIETPTLQLAFLPRTECGSEDLALWHACGREPEAVVPICRSHRPGYLPWLLEGEEVPLLAEIVRQTIGLAMRCEFNAQLLRPPAPDQIFVLSTTGGGAWQEEFCQTPAPSDPPPLQLDSSKLAQVTELPCHPERVQFDLALSRATVGEPGQRLRTAYLLAAFNSETGNCVGADVILPREELSALWHSVPTRLLDLCLHAGARPREIEVRSEQMMETLRPLLGKLPLRLTFRSELPHFEAFLAGMNRIATPQEEDQP